MVVIRFMFLLSIGLSDANMKLFRYDLLLFYLMAMKRGKAESSAVFLYIAGVEEYL